MNYRTLLGAFGELAARFNSSLLEFLPRLMGATAILLAGVGLAFLVRALARRFVQSLDRFVPGRRIRSGLAQVGMERRAADVIGNLLYWIILLFFLTAATETLGLPVVTTWLGGVATYLPKILAAVLIGFAGLVGGILLRDIVTRAAVSAGVVYGSLLGRLVQVALVLVTVFVGIEHVGVDITFLSGMVNIFFGALLFGAALAFGLGARTSISNILAAHYVQKIYKVGHAVRIGDLRGRIIQITPIAVVLETPEGRVLVPAKAFSEQASVLLTQEGG